MEICLRRRLKFEQDLEDKTWRPKQKYIGSAHEILNAWIRLLGYDSGVDYFTALPILRRKIFKRLKVDQ